MKVVNGVDIRPVSWAIPSLTISIFAADLVAPPGVAVSVLYVFPLLLTIHTSRERDPLYVCLGTIALLWTDLFLDSVALQLPYGVLNRVLGTLALWLLGGGLLQLKRTRNQLLLSETGKMKVMQDLMSERVERSHAEGLMEAAREARAYAETAVTGAVAGRQRAEEQYLISNLRLEGIINSAMDAIITVDHARKVVVFNEAAERMFRCSFHDAFGQSLDKFIPAPLREAHRHHVEGFARSGVTSRQMGRLGRVTGLRADGEEFPIEAAISHVTVEGTKFLTAILRDVTERTRLEEQLRRTERVAELGTLASGMAHEIGTPMNVILGRAEYLMTRVQDEPVKKGLQIIVTQVERITRVMNQLLSFARRKAPQRRPLRLQEVIETTLDLFRERLATHRVQVDMQVDASCPNIDADSDQMSQVLINLIMNALQAMPEEGRLHVGLAVNNDMAKLTVSDTGHGIPAAAVTKIFDPFFTTKEFGKGTGLGLTVVKGIIEEHHGLITVHSEEGKGTTFTILLPKSV
jgi:PAS domain S-box-containing protein